MPTYEGTSGGTVATDPEAENQRKLEEVERRMASVKDADIVFEQRESEFVGTYHNVSAMGDTQEACILNLREEIRKAFAIQVEQEEQKISPTFGDSGAIRC